MAAHAPRCIRPTSNVPVHRAPFWGRDRASGPNGACMSAVENRGQRNADNPLNDGGAGGQDKASHGG